MAKIKDIADSTGFSITTVSRVLNHDKTFNVSDETRIKILTVAEELNYTPPARRQRQTKKQERIKLALVYWYSQQEEVTDPYYLSIRMSIESYCQQHQIDLQKFYLNQHTFNDLKDLNFDGIMALGKFSDDELTQLHALHPYVVLVDSYTPHYEIDVVVADLKQATKQVIQYLLNKRLSRVGFICGVEQTIDGQEIIDIRLTTYQKQMKKHKLFNPHHVYLGQFCADSAYEIMSQIIEKNELLDAYIVASDSMAIGCLKALNEHQIKVPDTVSIVSYDNLSLSQYTIPSLTTVDMNPSFMGHTAVMTLLERIETERTIAKKITIPTKLIERESTK